MPTENYNRNVDGYLILAETKSGTLLNLENKFDYLTNGNSRTGYHVLKHRHFSDHSRFVNLNYLDAIEAYKRSESDKGFVNYLLNVVNL